MSFFSSSSSFRLAAGWVQSAWLGTEGWFSVCVFGLAKHTEAACFGNWKVMLDSECTRVALVHTEHIHAKWIMCQSVSKEHQRNNESTSSAAASCFYLLAEHFNLRDNEMSRHFSAVPFGLSKLSDRQQCPGNFNITIYATYLLGYKPILDNVIFAWTARTECCVNYATNKL